MIEITTNDTLLGHVTRRATMDASAKITSFSSKLPKDAPRLPIQWPDAEPKKKRAELVGQESFASLLSWTQTNDHDGLGATGDGGNVAEEQPSGSRHRYTLQQKKCDA